MLFQHPRQQKAFLEGSQLLWRLSRPWCIVASRAAGCAFFIGFSAANLSQSGKITGVLSEKYGMV